MGHYQSDILMTAVVTFLVVFFVFLGIEHYCKRSIHDTLHVTLIKLVPSPQLGD
jgi:hypothetical protein